MTTVATAAAASSGGGKFEFDDGGFYVGEWQNGHAEGFGVCTGPKGLGKFEGLWQDGIEVSGTYTWPNGMWYSGEWRDGHRHGYGLEKEADTKRIYSGQWLNGIKHGSGIVYSCKTERSFYEGTWKFGLQDGYGVEIYTDGGFYAGQWRDGMRHGFGVRGQTENDKLPDASASLKLLLQSPSREKIQRPATIYGLDSVYDQEQPKHRALTEETVHQLRRSVSSPADITTQPNVQSSNLETLEEVPPLKPTKPEKKQRKSVFSFRKSVHEKDTARKTSEVFKGYWDQDQREGYGVCYYGDGSQYIGEWRENRRHGYGILVDKDGKKSGGKWFSDNLLLMTRRKNLKLPMIKKKMNRIVLAGLDAAEKANKKMRLAISRGLSARKISDTAKSIATLAEKNAERAVECRKKYTLHPFLAASLSDFSRRAGQFSTDGPTNQQQSPDPSRKNSTSSLSRKSSTESKPERRKSTAENFRSRSDNNLDLDVLRSLEKHPVRERGLYAAMDTSIVAGAVSPFISQMILMNHNDAQTRMARAMSSTAVQSSQTTVQSMFASLNVLPTMKPTDECEIKRSVSCSDEPSNTSRSFLHPNDFTVGRRRKVGVSGQISVESSGSSITSEDARLVKMKGKLLTGDDIDYDYVAISTDLDGQETLVLHTNHPKPSFLKDHTISETTSINSATGLYRTVVGKVPSVLNITQPTGIPQLDSRRESLDSGTVNDDATPSNDDNDSYVAENDSINSRSQSRGSSALSQCEKTDDNTSYSYSPPSERSKRSINNLNENNNVNDKKNVTRKSSTVNVVKRTSVVQQVMIQKCSDHTQELSTQTSFDFIDTHESLDSKELSTDSNISSSSRLKIKDWLTKRLWSSHGSNHSVRSLSTDSGYKQSISMDDAHAPKTSTNNLNEYENNQRNSAELFTTVVSIENDKYRTLHSLDRTAERNKVEPVFNQYETIHEPTPHLGLRHIQVPAFIASPLHHPKDEELINDICDEYVIVGEDDNDDVSSHASSIDKVNMMIHRKKVLSKDVDIKIQKVTTWV